MSCLGYPIGAKVSYYLLWSPIMTVKDNETSHCLDRI